METVCNPHRVKEHTTMVELFVLEPGLVALSEHVVRQYELEKGRDQMLEDYIQKLREPTKEIKQ